MNKLQTLLIAGAVAGFAYAAGPAQAFPTYNFSGSDEGGTGSATMFFTITQDLDPLSATYGETTIVVDLENTSPITLDGSTDPNAPAIVAFGFDTDPETALSISNGGSWSLNAFDNGGNLVNIGGSAAGSGTDWVLGTSLANITLDYLPQTDHAIKGALYNPDAELGLAAPPNFFTTATLTLNLVDIFVPITVAEFTGTGESGSPLVRMQNVGAGGEGSLKLVGTPVPEPATLALLGIGLLGAGYMARRRRLEA